MARAELDALERVKQLFRFLKAFSERSLSLKRELAEQPWTLALRALPTHPAISLVAPPDAELEPERADEPASGGAGPRAGLAGAADLGEPDSEDAAEEIREPLLRVRRPQLREAPEPAAALREWLEPGWEHWDGRVSVREGAAVGPAERPAVAPAERGSAAPAERFDAAPERVMALAAWRAQWQAWADAERPARAAQDVFDRLYELRGRLQLEGEGVELMLGDGRLRWARPGEEPIDHPVLLQRVELEFEPGVPEFRVVDAERAPELYTPLLHGAGGLAVERLAELQRELESGEHHPLAGQATAEFLRRLAALLSARGEFRAAAQGAAAGPEPLLSRDPALFVRARAFGFPAAMDRVLEDLERGPELPCALLRAVGCEPAALPPPAERPHSPFGEPPDVLLSKPANPEQLEIARALERDGAVLVQGPPGTGKSHTIANLIGHLVAQGKRVLVTAHSTKALRVLREHVVESLRPLCVAALDRDLESRAQLEQAVRGIAARLGGASESGLTAQITRLERSRAQRLAELEQLGAQLRGAREAEYRPLELADGESLAPAQAAREAAQGVGAHDWLPGPLEPGAALPLGADEVQALYELNGALAPAEERELGEPLPRAAELPGAAEFVDECAALVGEEPAALARLWEGPADPGRAAALEQLRTATRALAVELGELTPWQSALLAAGHAGEPEAALWRALAAQVGELVARWQASRELLLEHAPELPAAGADPALEPAARLAALRELAEHVRGRGAPGALALWLRPAWRRALRGCRADGGAPRRAEHFEALAAQLELAALRERLAGRWARQAVPAGLPELAALPQPMEPVLAALCAQFEGLLEWWGARVRPLQTALAEAGFRWHVLRAQESAQHPARPPFETERVLLAGPVLDAVVARALAVRRRAAAERVRALAQRLVGLRGPIAAALRTAVEKADPEPYRLAFGRLRELEQKAVLRERRGALLARLEPLAPQWAQRLRERRGAHGASAVPGDAAHAWRWRQLQQELERRSALDELALEKRLTAARAELREVSAALIDRLAWLAQLRRTDLAARQALVGWLDTQRKLGKGTGKRAPELRAHARRLLEQARDAVPVWIMPLARVAESFDPRRGRFDVVIVDEASQADLRGLLAWYLGDRIAVVGDDEQVSPSDVGQALDPAGALIREHLQGIPNAHLYDGRASTYDLAKQCFSAALALREHFRSVPDIAEFSNQLSYGGQIRPLRDPASAPAPHVVECPPPAALGGERSGQRNLAEARWIAALLKAACEQPEYAGQSMGAIALVGDEQAPLIQQLAVALLGAEELERRRFVAGKPAQYQGDERGVIWLSLVDSPQDRPLPLADSAQRKQRFNVAASRARDQLWVVHSLDPERDLKEGDLRRRLIEHARDPAAPRRALQRALARQPSPLELELLHALAARGYRVEPQLEVGHYCMDLVVSDGRAQLAIECDGDRAQPLEQIAEDMARQAVLERAGWRFVRVRSTRYYRDPAGALDWVTGELARLGVQPLVRPGEPAGAPPPPAGEALRQRVLARAAQLLRERGWLPAEGTPSP